MKEGKELKKPNGSKKESNLKKNLKEFRKWVALETALYGIMGYFDLPPEYELPIKFLSRIIIKKITS